MLTFVSLLYNINICIIREKIICTDDIELIFSTAHETPGGSFHEWSLALIKFAQCAHALISGHDERLIKFLYDRRFMKNKLRFVKIAHKRWLVIFQS